MARAKRLLPEGCCFHITLRCNNRQFLITKKTSRDLILAIIHKAKKKFSFKLYGICLMSNHLHLLLKPSIADDLPKLMHWFAWYSAMSLNRLIGRCGHFWEARYFSTPIFQDDHHRILNTLRYIHANPKSAGIRKSFFDQYTNFGYYQRLLDDGISEWHPAFLKLATTLEKCSKTYYFFCQRYRMKLKDKKLNKSYWGSKILKNISKFKKRKFNPDQQSLFLEDDISINPIPVEWQTIARRFRKINGFKKKDRI